MPPTSRSLTALLNLSSPPVAITFVDAPPEGVRHVGATEPAGCGYWRRAAEGQVFYTTADDHKRCPVGAHTHHVVLNDGEQKALMGLVETMVGLSYLKVPGTGNLQIANDGGRAHTFTEVAAYGNGIVPPLNPNGNAPVPECAADFSESFIEPGATLKLERLDKGVHKYQCCFHPWMRAEVRVD